MGIRRLIGTLLGKGEAAHDPRTSPEPGAFELVKGVEITDLTGVEPAYQVVQQDGCWWIRANVSAPDLLETFLTLAELVPKPGFLILGVPTVEAVEAELRQGPEDPFHRDHYYLGGLDDASLAEVLREDAALFVHDGMLTFGFASHAGGHEVLVQRYKIFSLMVPDPAPYAAALEARGLRPVGALRTVMETFGPQTPGTTVAIDVDGLGAYDLVAKLEAKGLVFGRRGVN